MLGFSHRPAFPASAGSGGALTAPLACLRSGFSLPSGIRANGVAPISMNDTREAGPAAHAANTSARGQRPAILASPLHEFTGCYLAVECLRLLPGSRMSSALGSKHNLTTPCVTAYANHIAWLCVS
jgi:hypothetical protein